MRALLPLFLSIIFSAAAQLVLRYGMTRERNRRARWVASWFACFIVAFVLWMTALSRAEISLAYPLLGIGYVLVTVMAKVILGEHVSRLHWIAVATITAGVAIVGGSQ